MLVPLFFAAFLTIAVANFPDDAPEHLTTKLGRHIPVHVLRTRLRTKDPTTIRNSVFEITTEGHLVSHDTALHVETLAPEVTTIKPSRPISVTVNGEHHPSIRVGPNVRIGSGYTFVYDYLDGDLIAAWGPDIHLHALPGFGHHGIFLNTRAGHTEKSLNVDHDLHDTDMCESDEDDFPNDDSPPVVHEAGDVNRVSLSHGDYAGPSVTPVSRVSDWFRLKKEFEIVMVYDNTLCEMYRNSARHVHQVLQATAKAAGRIFRATLAEISLLSFTGHCIDKKDPFTRPKELDDCPLDSMDCSRSSIILNHLRDYYRFRTDFSRRDALYLITGYDAGNNVAGAAYRGAACNTDYAYGWIHGAHDNVFAHEMAHTLGAPHDKSGLMRPSIGSNEHPDLSETSVEGIDRFIKSVWNTWCLGSWDRYYSYGDTTLVGIRMQDENVEGSDITFADISGDGQVDLFMLHVGKQNRSDYLYFSVAENVRRVDENRYRFETWAGTIRVPNTKGYYQSGGGIAFGNIRSPRSKDLVVSFVDKGKIAYYQLGFGMDIDGLAGGGWSNLFRIPVRLGNLVKCMGITVGDVRGKGGTDFVLVYVNVSRRVHYAYYVIGYDLGPDGKARGGWSEPMDIPGWLGYFTGDISVALYDTIGNGKMDLIVHSNERSLSIWRGSFRIGRDLDENGQVTGLWSTTIPAQGSPLVAVMPRLTGGIAIAKVGNTRKPTTVILQSVTFPAERSVISYLELGFDLLSAAEAEVNTSTIRNVMRSPVSQCSECYRGAKSSSCEKKFELCTLTDQAFVLETVQLERQTAVTLSKANVTVGPDTESLFCKGFHDLFVEGGSDACRTDVGTEDVMSAGLAGALHNALVAFMEDGSITLEYRIEFDLRKSLIVETTRTAGPSKLPHSVVVKVISSKALRKDKLDRTLERIKHAKDFQRAFQRKAFKIKRGEDNKVWIFTIGFAKEFQLEYYKDDRLVRVNG